MDDFRVLIAISTRLFLSATSFKKCSLGFIFHNCAAFKERLPNSSDNSKSSLCLFSISICVMVIILSEKKNFIVFQNCRSSVTFFYV